MAYIRSILAIIEENKVDIEFLHINFNRFIYKKDDSSIDDKLMNSTLYVMLEGEKIYTKIISIPKVSKSSIFNIVKVEFSYYFKNVDDILFSYKIIEEKKDEYKLLILYINSSQIDFIKKNESILIKKITPIQLLAERHFEKKIDSSNFIVVFNYNKYCYFTLHIQNNIVASYVEKASHDFNYVEKFYIFLEKYCDDSTSIDKVFFINFPYKEDIEEIGEKFTCNVLGLLHKSDLISLYR